MNSSAKIAGTQINGLLNLVNTTAWTVTGLVGFRYFDLDETLSINQTTREIGSDTIPFFDNQANTNPVPITDRFHTRNQFYGAQIGVDSEYRWKAFYFDFGADVGFGPDHEIVEVTGQTVQAGTATGGPGGFLAAGSSPNGNIGRATANPFTLLADVHGLVGVQVTSRLRIGAGYSFTYLSNVVRPGNQISTAVDPRLVPTTAIYGGLAPSSTAVGGAGTPPNSPGVHQDFYVSGVRFQIEYQY